MSPEKDLAVIVPIVLGIAVTAKNQRSKRREKDTKVHVKKSVVQKENPREEKNPRKSVIVEARNRKM